MRFKVLMAAVLAMSVPVIAGSQLPSPWFLAGNDASHYDAGIEFTKEARALCIRSLPGAGLGFGTIMQTFPAEPYRGKRLCLSADVMVEGVSQWGGLWMRVDGPGKPAPTLAFDNMNKRPIRGTAKWTSYEVVLDVPQGAESVSIGALLNGPGQLWVTAVRFEPVDKSHKTTLPVAPKK